MIEATARDAWHELEGKLRPFIAHRVRSSADADDVLQDALLRLQRGLTGLRDDQRFGPWVYQVARSAIAEHRRQASRHPLADSAAADDGHEDDHEDDDWAGKTMAAYVGRFVAMLPSPQREALTLTELEGLAQREAAEILGVSLSCLKSRVQRGRQRLRELFEECCIVGLDPRGHVRSCAPRPGSPLSQGCSCDLPTNAMVAELTTRSL